jgi:tRNA(Arg) A34 adenosine deaminase TadA
MPETSDVPKRVIRYRKDQPMIPGLVDAVIADQERFNREIEDKYLGIQQVFDHFFLKGAPRDIYEELRSYRDREFPVFAAVLKPRMSEYEGRQYTQYEVLSESGNTVNQHKLSDEHAEIVALRNAATALGSKHLTPDCVLVSTVEPCTACAKTFLNYQGRTLIFGASHDDLRGNSYIVNEVNGGEQQPVEKKWNTEPMGYSARDFIQERNPEVTVLGGYRRSDVLSYINNPFA